MSLLFRPLGEISQSSVFSQDFCRRGRTAVVCEYAPRGGTPTLFFNEETQGIILSRGQSVLSLAIEKKKRLSLRNPFLPTLTTTTTKKRASRLKNRRKKFFSTEREKEAREKTESRARAKRWYPLAGEKDVRERRARCRRFSFCYFRCCYFRRRRRRREQHQQQQQQ